MSMKLEAASWHYKGTFGDLGPLTLEEIEDLVDGGVIEPGTYVWNPSLPSWLPASSCGELRAALSRRAPMMEPPPSPTTGPGYGVGIPPAAGLGRPGLGSSANPFNFGDAYTSPPQNFGTAAPHAPYGVARSAYSSYTPPQAANLGVYGMVSDRSRLVAGLLNLFLPGVGRMYLGYSALGVIQLLSFLFCGIGLIWSFIDGVLILTGTTKIDGYGRVLRD